MPLPPAPQKKGDRVARSQFGSRVSPPRPAPAPAAAAQERPPQASARSAERPAAARSRPAPARQAGRKGVRKCFVLDTNVLLHDPGALFMFQEHDVFLPMTTLEELDDHKTGLSDLARNARQVSRYLDQLIAARKSDIAAGLELSLTGHSEAGGRLFFETEALSGAAPAGLSGSKADNRVLATVGALREARPDRVVVLVSKDINMRVKAAALGFPAEDFLSDKAIADTDVLYSGRTELDAGAWARLSERLSAAGDGRSGVRLPRADLPPLGLNEFVISPDGRFVARVGALDQSCVTLRPARDHTQPKNAVWGISARNPEQSMALNLLLDPEIDFVTILGQAGTGKTLLALAAALTLTLDQRRFAEIIFTRATVSVGEDIGYLPGTEEEKMLPWMGALDDNLEVLNRSERRGGSGDWGRDAAIDLIRSRVRVKSMSLMRGRTFLNKFVIIDEAQNLSPKQMRTLITRAGPGTKMVCLGNIAQIDTPYLSEGSSGLTYVVERFRGWEHAGHITLLRGERSRLADFASEAL